jgi:hypothetical protein
MPPTTRPPAAPTASDGERSSPVEQLVRRLLGPLGLVVLSRERIQQALEEAVERGRITRSDANDLALELVRRGRQQTEELLSELDRLFGLGRRRLATARRAARRTGGGEPRLPIEDYDRLPAVQVRRRLRSLSEAELRVVHEYERRHANRKSVLAALERALR